MCLHAVEIECLGHHLRDVLLICHGQAKKGQRHLCLTSKAIVKSLSLLITSRVPWRQMKDITVCGQPDLILRLGREGFVNYFSL